MPAAVKDRNFAMTGVAGYVATRHLRAIRDTGNHLVAALDPHDSVGVLDQFGLDIRFFTEFERFDRYLEKLRQGAEEGRVHYVSICSPNYLHDAHCRLALRLGADAICEKPLVINPWNLAPLRDLEAETGRRIHTVLQLRLHEKLSALRSQLQEDRAVHDVLLTYVTSRGSWYDTSWKGDVEKSGGVAINIGIHLFDLLLWLFGSLRGFRVYLSEKRRMAGFLDLERARVRWFLSIESADLPAQAREQRRSTYRWLSIDGNELDFTDGFTDLHTLVYEQILNGGGFGIADAEPSIELAYRLRTASLSAADDLAHPLLRV